MQLAGRLLVAMPALADPNFYRSVVHILEHDDGGTLGLIVNRPSWMEVAEHLPEIADVVVPPEVVFIGGPVQRAIAVTVIRDASGRPRLVEEPAADGPCRVFSGYAGWGAGQLAEEIAEGSWYVTDSEPDDVFSEHPETLWSDVWKRQTGRMRMLATFPPDLRSN